MVYFGADIEQDRLHLLESSFIPADHKRKLPLLKSDNAAGYGRVEHLRALFGDLFSKMTRCRRADSTHIDVHLALAQTGKDAIGAVKYLLQGLRIGDHCKYDIGRLGNGAGRFANACQHPAATAPLTLCGYS